jgi:aromatic ring-opening dioxygenase catalytic subunit (LigB family)
MEDYMGDPEGYGMLKNYLEKLGKEYREKIESLLVISAHWEEPLPAVHFGSNPSMFYDYYGFNK